MCSKAKVAIPSFFKHLSHATIDLLTLTIVHMNGGDPRLKILRQNRKKNLDNVVMSCLVLLSLFQFDLADLCKV